MNIHDINGIILSIMTYGVGSVSSWIILDSLHYSKNNTFLEKHKLFAILFFWPIILALHLFSAIIMGVTGVVQYVKEIIL